MTERQSVSLQQGVGERRNPDGLLAANDDLVALAEQYARLNIEEVLPPGERRRINDVAEVIGSGIEEGIHDVALLTPVPSPEGLLAPAAGQPVPLPQRTD
jgi:hypothetical protein